MNQPADPRAARAAFYEQIAAQNMTALWESLATLVPESPRSPCVPALWRYDQVRPWLMQSGTLISAAEAVRRVLILENPGLPGTSSITQSLYAGLQLILPGEVAPSHRHTQSALRLIVEGNGAYTSVEGERATMHPGDFIITPSWTWHDHGSNASEPVVWLDGLDIPLIRFFDCGFAENGAQAAQALARAEGDALARYGNNLLPVDYEPSSSSSPMFAYPYSRTRESLHRLLRDGSPHAAHGHKMQFINPTTGGPAMPTMAAFVQLLPAGFSGAGHRGTDATVFHAIEGRGRAHVAGQSFDFAARDTFVVPSWTVCRLEAAAECVLFSYSDRPVQRAMGVWREEVLPA